MIKKKLNEIDSSYPGFWQSSWLLFVLFIAYTLSFIDRQILTLLVDPIQKSIGLSAVSYTHLTLPTICSV